MSFRSSSSTRASAALAVVLAVLPACSQVRGRKRIQDANELYRRGRYTEAVALYKEAEAFVPELPTLWLNEGYTCRQLIAPGGQDAESRRAAECALAAFKRLHEVAPKDTRATDLTFQTWYDVRDYAALETALLDRQRQAPGDIDAVRGLQDIYFRWGKWTEALEWSKRAAALQPNDAEAQYGVGTFVWQILSSHGGGAQAAGYSPWPGVAGTTARPTPGPGDVADASRVELADQGIRYLHQALARRARYPEAMTYLGLLWRQKSFAFFSDPIAWQGAVDLADDWQKRALEQTRAGKS